MPRISTKNQVTLPVKTLAAVGLAAGDVVSIEAESADVIVIRRVAEGSGMSLGVFDGLYEPGYLDRLRADERA